MEVAPGNYRIVKDQWIVRSAVQFDLKDSPSVRQRVPDGTVYLWDAAQAIGILNAATLAMASGNRAPKQEVREVVRAQYLSGVRPSRMQTRVERCGRSKYASAFGVK